MCLNFLFSNLNLSVKGTGTKPDSKLEALCFGLNSSLLLFLLHKPFFQTYTEMCPRATCFSAVTL